MQRRRRGKRGLPQGAGALRMRECSQEGGKTAVEEISGLTINFIMLQS